MDTVTIVIEKEDEKGQWIADTFIAEDIPLIHAQAIVEVIADPKAERNYDQLEKEGYTYIRLHPELMHGQIYLNRF